MIVFLDTGVLGQIASPSTNAEIKNCKRWFEKLTVRGAYFVTSDICDYEARRGLLVAAKAGKKAEGLQNLQELRNKTHSQFSVDFLAVTQEVLGEAADIWSETQVRGSPLTHPERLDADSIVCAHSRLLETEYQGRFVVVATTNTRDIGRFAEADEWQNISL